MFIESYMDESGIHNGAKICVVAGYYGTREAWAKVESQWRNVLQDYDLDKIGFHSKRFWKKIKDDNEEISRVSPYKGWDDDKANKFLQRLLETIVRNRIFPFGYGVVVEHWTALPLNARKLMTGATHRRGRFISSGSPERSYYLPFMFSVAASLAHSGAPESGKKVHFFVGLDKSFSGYAKEMYDRSFTAPQVKLSHLLGTIAFPLSKDTPQLQAADLLAHQLHREYMAFLRGAKRRMETTRLLLHNQRQRVELFGAQKLQEILEEYKADAFVKTGRTPPFLDE